MMEPQNDYKSMWVRDIMGRLINLDFVKIIYVQRIREGGRVLNPMIKAEVQAVGVGDSPVDPIYTLAEMKTEKEAQEYIDRIYEEVL